MCPGKYKEEEAAGPPPVGARGSGWLVPGRPRRNREAEAAVGTGAPGSRWWSDPRRASSRRCPPSRRRRGPGRPRPARACTPRSSSSALAWRATQSFLPDASISTAPSGCDRACAAPRATNPAWDGRFRPRRCDFVGAEQDSVRPTPHGGRHQQAAGLGSASHAGFIARCAEPFRALHPEGIAPDPACTRPETEPSQAGARLSAGGSRPPAGRPGPARNGCARRGGRSPRPP
jgi:hypothetical protein